jgi:hypothetical protein
LLTLAAFVVGLVWVDIKISLVFFWNPRIDPRAQQLERGSIEFDRYPRVSRTSLDAAAKASVPQAAWPHCEKL